MQMLRTKPFCGATPVCARPTRVLRITAAQQQSPLKTLAIKRDEQAEVSPSVLPLASVAALTTLFTASRAMAVEVPEVSAEDITIMAASQPDAGIQSVIVGLLFGTVVALLLVVTGGVAYINIKQWLDARQEKEDRDKEKAAPAAAASSSSAKSSGKEEDPNAVVPLKRANRIKKEKGKGFAAADQFTSRR